MTAKSILEQLKQMGNETIRNTFLRHGATEPIYGVKVEDLKKIQKKIGKDYLLSKELYSSGVSDARYLAGLIADEKQMTKEEIQDWADQAGWYMISEFTVAWIASESRYGWELAMEWIDSPNEMLACSGWSTISSIMSIKNDGEIDLRAIELLIKRVEQTIHQERNRVRYTMNAFLIAVGSYVAPLTKEAKRVAEKIGKVSVDMGGTSCKVPYAPDYIEKVEERGRIGVKRKSPRC